MEKAVFIAEASSGAWHAYYSTLDKFVKVVVDQGSHGHYSDDSRFSVIFRDALPEIDLTDLCLDVYEPLAPRQAAAYSYAAQANSARMGVGFVPPPSGPDPAFGLADVRRAARQELTILIKARLRSFGVLSTQ